MSSTKYYSTQEIKQLEVLAMQGTKNTPAIPNFTLMQRAGLAAFNLLQEKYPKAKNIVVLCGAGNNAGDGYILAALAQEAGLDARCYYLKDPEALKEPAISAYHSAKKAGVVIESFETNTGVTGADIIVDALLGTGIQGSLQKDYLKAIESINAAHKPILAIDVPSGLNADTGEIIDCAVKADVTMTFIGLKLGFSMENSEKYCGELHLNKLGLAEELYQSV